MKRWVSTILVALVALSSLLLLTACNGGIYSEEDWNNALEYFQNCDTVTIELDDNNLHMNYIRDKERVISNALICFNASKGFVFVSMEYSRRNFWGTQVGGATYETYYVQDGLNVYCYSRRVSGDTPEEWNVNEALSFDSEEAAEAYLRKQYLQPVDVDSNAFPSMLELNYNDFSPKMSGKFERKTSDNRFNYTYVLNFAGGKVTKYAYQNKAPGGNVDDARKFSMTITYSASVSLPDELQLIDRIDGNA